MDFLTLFKAKQLEFNNDFISICNFINSIHKSQDENIANIALAMRFFDISKKLHSYTATDDLETTKNAPEILNDFLNDLVNYGIGYDGGIRGDTFNKFKNIYFNKSEINDIPEFKNTLPKIESLSKVEIEAKSLLEAIKRINDSVSFNKSYLTPIEAVGIMCNSPTNDLMEKIGAFETIEDWEALASFEYIRKNLMNGRLFLDSSSLCIPAVRLKMIMYEDGKIIKGFNDDILNSIYEEYISPSIEVKLLDDGKLATVLNLSANNKDDILNSYPMALEKENKRLNDEITQLRASNELSVKDSILATIAVMKNILLDMEITGGYFANSDNDKAPKEPSQDMLSLHIEELAKELNIRGLSKRNVNDIFSQANKKLNELMKN